MTGINTILKMYQLERHDTMADSNKPFQLASKEQLRQYAHMSAQSRRSPGLQRAWEDREKLIERYKNGEWILDLAKEYDTNKQNIYRIIRSDG